MRTQPFLGDARGDDRTPSGALTENQLIAELARLYYLEDVSKVELGRRFDISRFKIARMLAKGRETGIIRVEIHEPTTNLPAYSDPLMRSLGLPLVRVIESKGAAETVRDAVGVMGAQLLREAIEDGDTVGIGSGRTLLALTAQVSDPPAVRVVELCGAVPSAGTTSPLEQMRERVEQAGGSVRAVGAPLFAGSQHRRDSWVAQLHAVHEMHDHLDLAVVGIGAWVGGDGEVRRAFPPAIQEQLDAAGPVAEMLGHWFTVDGAVVAQDITRMCVTTETYQLSAAPHVVAVAAGAEKARAIMGVARSGLITGLITDQAAAERMLEIARE